MEVKYFPAVMTFDLSQGFSIIDQTTGEQKDYPTGTSSVDLSEWWMTASPLFVNISATRWTHELWLRQPNGESFEITKGHLQGTWSREIHGHGWFTSYYYFDIVTNAHPDLEWWIYDATTREVASS